jgi:hypothetical protein
VNPISEIEWKLNEHKHWLAEIETYRRQLGYDQFDRVDYESMTARAKRTLIALSAKIHQFLGAVYGGSAAQSVGNSRPETNVNQ